MRAFRISAALLVAASLALFGCQERGSSPFAPEAATIQMAARAVQSLTPKQVLVDVTDMVGSPSVDYRGMRISIVGKNTDDTSYRDEVFSTQRYGTIFGRKYTPSFYSGPSTFLVITFQTNGLNQIGTYPAGNIRLRIDGAPFLVRLPGFSMVIADNFSFYIADDGSTFYGRSDHMAGNAIISGDGVAKSINLSPTEAFVPAHSTAPPPATPGPLEEQLQEIIASVQDLIDDGVLDKGGNGLLGIRNAALRSVQDERPNALRQLNAFISAVEGAITSGRLTAEQGQALIDAMQSIIDELST